MQELLNFTPNNITPIRFCDKGWKKCGKCKNWEKLKFCENAGNMLKYAKSSKIRENSGNSKKSATVAIWTEIALK